jgi:hypothetical protein
MKGLNILFLIAAGCLIAGPLHADIYQWTDENGIKHFTNHAPKGDVKDLIKTEELPYDEAADRARMKADWQYQLDLARLEIAEREAELRLREAEAERKAAEAERYAQETMRQADRYMNDARNYYYHRGVRYYGHYYPSYAHHYKRKYHNRSNKHWHKIKKTGKFHRKKHIHHRKYRSPNGLRISYRSNSSAFRVKGWSTGHSGRRHLRRGSFGY